MNDAPRLEPVEQNIWIAEGENVDFYGFVYPTRAVIVRLPIGALWVWSPIALSDTLKEELAAIGAPAHLVSPNKIHHLYLQDWKAAFPAAKLWGPASTIKKRRDLSFEPALSDVPPSAWEGEFDMVRFAGSPVMDEIVFFHKTSRTVILADLSEHFDEEFLKEHWKWWQRIIARFWGIVEGRGFAPLEWRLSFFRRKKARAALEQMLAWNPERVIMAHGAWQRSNGRSFLEKAFAWLH